MREDVDEKLLSTGTNDLKTSTWREGGARGEGEGGKEGKRKGNCIPFARRLCVALGCLAGTSRGT